jgi:hypothetical protein
MVMASLGLSKFTQPSERQSTSRESLASGRHDEWSRGPHFLFCRIKWDDDEGSSGRRCLAMAINQETERR